ncbi:MAG: hypothetical protein EPN97_03460 [Alphaproteobacteria bacterium]|nr:MAG: hypothetical protein EPN97_03460 [Alphaproteobacteria bacterium]
MKHAWKIIAMAALLASSGALAAETPDVAVKAGGQSCVAGVDGDVCSHFFGASDVTVSIVGGAKDCAPSRAVLMQMSTRLEAPVEGAVTPAEFDGCKAQELVVHLPKVTNETEFRVNISSGDAKTGKVILVPLKAYPRDLMNPLKTWAKDEHFSLVVKDKDGRLTGFLDRNDVVYSTGAASAKTRKLTIVVADPEDMKEGKPEGDVLYLTEKVKDMPLVSVEKTAQGATAIANIKILDGLSADDPLAEKAFVKIFTMISK